MIGARCSPRKSNNKFLIAFSFVFGSNLVAMLSIFRTLSTSPLHNGMVLVGSDSKFPVPKIVDPGWRSIHSTNPAPAVELDKRIPETNVYTLQESDDITPVSVNVSTPASLLLQSTDNSSFLIYTDGCCGLGHRLSRNIPTIVYANRHKRQTKVWWIDIPWSTIFKDTNYVMSGKRDEWSMALERDRTTFANSFPKDWASGDWSTTNRHGAGVTTHTTLDEYNPQPGYVDLLYSPHAIAILKSLREALTPLVLSFLNPIRAQVNHVRKEPNHMSICVHVREGNNETGDWQSKSHRHIDLGAVVSSTLNAIESLVLSPRNVTKASLYVASDNPTVRPWFEENVPQEWNVIKPGKVVPRPEKGHWFELGIDRDQDDRRMNEALAEAAADLFALGECDALMIPNYSSFTYTAIALSRARGIPIFFGMKDGDHFEYNERSDLLA